MTRQCPRCSADNLPEAKYCESCGTDLDAPLGSGEPTQSLETRPGSLRDAIPFLTGGVDQAKARFDGWKQKKARTDTEKAREKHFEEQARQDERQDERGKRETFGKTVTRVLVGLLALAILIYLIVRNPNLPPWMAQQLVDQLMEDWGLGSV
jgi:hypothetical protein